MIYLLFKLLHIVAVVLFLGNISTGVFWVHHAARGRSPARLADAMDGVIRSDRLFTIPAVFLLAAGGVLAAVVAGLPLLRTGWIAWGLGLFLLSGLLFAPVARLQRSLRDTGRQPDAQWATCEPLLRRWTWLGLASLSAAWAALAVMVLKLPQ